jgi:hypothetical protein
MSDTYQTWAFPMGGIDRSQAFSRQPVRQTQAGYVRTAPIGHNVRAYDPKTNRARGGQRPGLARYINERVNGAVLIQLLNQITGVGYTAPGGGVQSSQSGRLVTLVAICQGTIKVADAGAETWTIPTNGTTALNTTGVIYSAVNGQKMYFVDGTNYKRYDPATNTVEAWTATAGTLPVDSAGNKPRLICTWRGRTVLSGLLKDAQNWFMSEVDDPTDFDYGPALASPTQAVAGNNSSLGLVGDVITALIPFNDDLLIFGGDHTIWAMRGDPMAGGQIDQVSDAIGIAWGMAWCRDPYGTIYFVSNRMGIYAMTAGSAPVRISQPIENLLTSVNTGANTISLIWDDRYQGLHVFVTATAGAAAATHLFWEMRSGAWWTDSFAKNNFNPLVCCTFDGNTPDDRVALIGSWDGYVRFLDPDATSDDGNAIASEVWLGPLMTKDFDELMLKDLVPTLAEDSGDVLYAIYVGNTAEAALASDPVATGTWTSARNLATFVRRSGHAVFVQLTATSPWALESIVAKLQALGKVRRRVR